MKRARTSRSEYFVALNGLFNDIPKGEISGFLKSSVPKEFEKDFDNTKTLFLEIQNNTLLKIQKYMSNDTLNVATCEPKLKLAEWSLPDV
jgi:hypothetical protein